MHDRVVATGRAQISDLIMGSVLRRPILVVGVPVFRDGHVVLAGRDAVRDACADDLVPDVPLPMQHAHELADPGRPADSDNLMHQVSLRSHVMEHLADGEPLEQEQGGTDDEA